MRTNNHPAPATTICQKRYHLVSGNHQFDNGQYRGMIQYDPVQFVDARADGVENERE